MVLTLALAAVLAPSWASAAEIAIVVGGPGALREAAEAQARCLPPGKAEVFEIPPGAHGAVEAIERVRHSRPTVLSVVGARAAREAGRAFPDAPLVYLMVVFPERLGLLEREGAHGVAWQPGPAALVGALRLLFPDAQRVGTLSSLPARRRAELARSFAAHGLELVVAPAASPADIPDALRALHGAGVSALWLGLDPMTAEQERYEIIRAHALQNRLPLVAPFELGPDSKALAGLAVPAQESGKAACALAADLLAGREPPHRLAPVDSATISIDLSVAREIGLTVPAAALKAARVQGP